VSLRGSVITVPCGENAARRIFSQICEIPGFWRRIAVDAPLRPAWHLAARRQSAHPGHFLSDGRARGNGPQRPIRLCTRAAYGLSAWAAKKRSAAAFAAA
jgi:hypothetical protein